MKKRLAILLVAIGLIAAACSSSTQDTTTTSAGDAGAPATSPASVSVEDQMSDGTTIVVASVELPSAGFIAVHADNGGSPGAVIGHSDLLPAGTSEDVTVVLDTPIEGTSIVWPMAHIDIDGDGVYTFAPPDDAVDVPAINADGNVAVAPAAVMLLPSRAPSALEATDQEGLGLGIVVASVTLPAQGFVAVHGDADGAPGPVIGHSKLLAAGTTTDVEIIFDEPLEASGKVYPMLHIDMDEDGEYTFEPPDNAVDLPALFDSGDIAVVAIDVVVLPSTAPSALEADEQTSDGATIIVKIADLPANGFIAVHADADGSPGPVIGHSDLLQAGENKDVVITLDEGLGASGVVWPMIHIDMDGDGEYTFMPPDNAVDVPGITADENVAVIPVQINL
ncbi:MAG: hypothetical protein M3112_00590 [Actinomycetia bacterium]|nr:hypothetical protein [Actinomycetes bacterium]